MGITMKKASHTAFPCVAVASRRADGPFLTIIIGRLVRAHEESATLTKLNVDEHFVAGEPYLSK
jgi:hypothetical protein